MTHPCMESDCDQRPEPRGKLLHEPGFFFGRETAITGVVFARQAYRGYRIEGESPLADRSIVGSLQKLQVLIDRCRFLVGHHPGPEVFNLLARNVGRHAALEES